MKIGLIGAEKQEVELLFASLSGAVQVTKKASLEFHEGFLHGVPVVVVCCGIGKVNAALCAQILISEFKVRSIINTGTAGGLEPKLAVLDMVVSTDTVQHDFDTTAFGYLPGQIPGTESPFFQADSTLRSLALKSFERVSSFFAHTDESNENVNNRDIYNSRKTNENREKTILETAPKMIPGRIASGDAFISEMKKRQQIIESFSPTCVEMEGAAIAQVCTLHKIPFVILRSISDLAGSDAGMSYADFSRAASLRSAAVVEDMVAQMAKGEEA